MVKNHNQIKILNYWLWIISRICLFLTSYVGMFFIIDIYGILIFVYTLQRLDNHYNHYTFDESTEKKVSNKVMNFLYHFLKNILSPNVKQIYIFSDNQGTDFITLAIYYRIQTKIAEWAIDLFYTPMTPNMKFYFAIFYIFEVFYILDLFLNFCAIFC